MKQGKVCFENHCFDVDLAISGLEKKKGLMFVQNLSQDRGMLFVYEKNGEYGFWMKNTKIPLDIIWIDENNKVVDISSNTPICLSSNCPVVKPKKEARYVLEINAGIAEKIGIQRGSILEIVN